MLKKHNGMFIILTILTGMSEKRENVTRQRDSVVKLNKKNKTLGITIE